MSDLQSQLMAKLGAAAPVAEPETRVKVDPNDPLGDTAHLATPWLEALQAEARRAGGLKVPARPSLNAAKQLHDRLGKQLKGQGKNRLKRELDDLRSRYLKRRDKLAWTRLKTTLTDAGASPKFYRSVKQSGVEPERALTRLDRTGAEKLRAMNQADLRALVLGN